jgi:ABC-2 type transport system permease protein
MRPLRKAQPFWTQLIDLVLIQLSNWRWSWRNTIITGMVAPIISITLLSFFAPNTDVEALMYILTGNIVLALMFENLNKVSSNFIFMRIMKSLDYFASLPIQGYNLILATVIAFMLLSLPSVVLTLIFGTILMNIPLSIHPAILIVIPLSAIALAGIGALIGSLARTFEEASAISMLVTLLFLGLGPVILPLRRLPDFMVTVGYLSPATYAASAVRQTLLGPVTGRLLLDLLVLGGISIVLLSFASRRILRR